jgi:predicted nuclease of predicted toxin-antitoxin system
VKLLFDNNLSYKLVLQLAHLYPECSHIAALGLEAATDLEVWRYAQQHDCCLVTKDADFNDLLAAKGYPPKVLWIRLGNCTTAEIATLLRTHHETVNAFLEDNSVVLLELQ